MTTIYDYVSFDTAGKSNDCGIIALAALAGAKRGTRVAYGAAARTLISAGAFSERTRPPRTLRSTPPGRTGRVSWSAAQ